MWIKKAQLYFVKCKPVYKNSKGGAWTLLKVYGNMVPLKEEWIKMKSMCEFCFAPKFSILAHRKRKSSTVGYLPYPATLFLRNTSRASSNMLTRGGGGQMPPQSSRLPPQWPTFASPVKTWTFHKMTISAIGFCLGTSHEFNIKYYIIRPITVHG